MRDSGATNSEHVVDDKADSLSGEVLAPAFLCESCQRQASAPGMCAHCPDEPLVNMQDEEAMRLIQARENRRVSLHNERFMILSTVLMLPVNVVLLGLSLKLFTDFFDYSRSGTFFAPSFITLPFFLLIHLVIWLLSGAVVGGALVRRFPIKRGGTK